MGSSIGDIAALADLLREGQEAPTAVGGSTTIAAAPGPQAAARSGTVVKSGAAAAAAVAAAAAAAPGAAAAPAAAADSRSIWSEAEVLPAADVMAVADGRRRPEFEYMYKQAVGSEDVYLGLSGTTPSSVHCTSLVLRVLLPGERFADIDLDVTAERVVVAAAHLCVGGVGWGATG